jgi:hypothetical protein
VDYSFNESPPVETRIQVPDDEPPAAPTALQLRNVEGRLVEISWSAGGSLDVESYQLTRTTVGTATDPAGGGSPRGRAPGASTNAAGGDRVEIGTVPASGRLRLRDESVRTGSEYRYHLVAVDSAGNVSEPTEAALRFQRLAAPPSTLRVQAAVVENGVRITWERVVDSELVGYRIYRATISTGVYESISEVVPAGRPLEFIDRSGRSEHYYQVRAVDRSGNESRPSPAATAGGA